MSETWAGAVPGGSGEDGGSVVPSLLEAHPCSFCPLSVPGESGFPEPMRPEEPAVSQKPAQMPTPSLRCHLSPTPSLSLAPSLGSIAAETGRGWEEDRAGPLPSALVFLLVHRAIRPGISRTSAGPQPQEAGGPAAQLLEVRLTCGPCLSSAELQAPAVPGASTAPHCVHPAWRFHIQKQTACALTL